MSMLFALLVVATFPTLYFDWRYYQSSFREEIPIVRPPMPMHCFYNAVNLSYIHETCYGHQDWPSEGPFVSGLFAMAFLIISYTTRLVKLFGASSTFFRRNVRVQSGRLLKRLLSLLLQTLDIVTFRKFGPVPWFFLVECPLITIYMNCRLAVDLYASMLSDIVGLLFGCIVALHRLIQLKRRETAILGHQGQLYVAEKSASTIHDAAPWGFGQLLPLARLVTPIFTVGQVFMQNQLTAGGICSNNNGHVHQIHPSAETKVSDRDYRRRSLASVSRESDNRRRRFYHMAEKDLSWTQAWVPTATRSVGITALFMLATVYRLLTGVPEYLQDVFSDLIVIAIGFALSLPVSWAPVSVGAVLTGWKGKRLNWMCCCFTAASMSATGWNYYHAIRFWEQSWAM